MSGRAKRAGVVVGAILVILTGVALATPVPVLALGDGSHEVVTPLDEGEVRSFCQGQIAHFKIPRFVRFVEAFPMTVSGKPQKFKMREQMIEELGRTVHRTA